MRELGVFIAFVFVIGIIFLGLWFGLTPKGRMAWNNWFHAVQVADDNTNYETLQQVENTARAMIASYNNDKLIWLQYKDSEVSEQVSWANQAKMRANQTASTYNNYILQNDYVWANNIPSDIAYSLAYLS